MAGTKELGEKIKAARAGKGWKQKHLAAEVAVEPITVSRWERGATTPDLDVLRLVADATGRPLSFFVEEGAAMIVASTIVPSLMSSLFSPRSAATSVRIFAVRWFASSR